MIFLTLLAITSSPIVNVLIYLVISALIFWLVWWLLGVMGLPEPFNKIIRVIVAVIVVIVVANILLGLIGISLL